MKEQTLIGKSSHDTFGDRAARPVDDILDLLKWSRKSRRGKEAFLRGRATHNDPAGTHGRGLSGAKCDRRGAQLTELYLAQQLSLCSGSYHERHPTGSRNLPPPPTAKDDKARKASEHPPPDRWLLGHDRYARWLSRQAPIANGSATVLCGHIDSIDNDTMVISDFFGSAKIYCRQDWARAGRRIAWIPRRQQQDSHILERIKGLVMRCAQTLRLTMPVDSRASLSAGFRRSTR